MQKAQSETAFEIAAECLTTERNECVRRFTTMIERAESRAAAKRCLERIDVLNSMLIALAREASECLPDALGRGFMSHRLQSH